ncbi:hypothetical protein ACNTMW_27185 [Planosporangium sp. 12N6]|uniref:hypothetical protein n=1 Tax=Planosporangium spinosum TaxID=3402278 RepID=UPI003CF76637
MSYDELMRELSAAATERDDARRAAVGRHDAECAAAAAALRRARAEATESGRRQRAADDLFARVQQETAGQWQRLRGQLPGRLRARLGALPRPVEPSRAQAGVDRPEQGASELIGEARQLLDELHRRPPLPGGAYPVLIILAVAGAGLSYLGARGLLLLGRQASGPVGTVLDTLGQITAVASALGGLPTLKWFADRSGARLSAGAVATVLAAGVGTLVALGMLTDHLR